MGSTDRVAVLRDKHAQIEAEITRECQSPHADFDHVAELKRQKLRLKDEIVVLEKAEH